MCEVMAIQEIEDMTNLQPTYSAHDQQMDAMAAQPIVYAMLVPVQAAMAMQAAGMMVMANPQAAQEWMQPQEATADGQMSGYMELAQPYMESESSLYNYEGLYTEGEAIEQYDQFNDDEDRLTYRTNQSSSGRRRRRQRASERMAQPKAPGMVIPQPVMAQIPEASAVFSSERMNELREELEGTTLQRSAALEAISGNVWGLSRDVVGCRLVQLAFEKADPRMAKALSFELQGHIREAATSPHGNYVVQKVVTHLAPGVSSFVAEELLGNGARFARHRFGCRILCRLLEHCSKEEGTRQLVDEVLEPADEALDLCRHSFGHHVVQSILEHGDSRHKELIAEVLHSDLLANANHRSASYVVEAALCHCEAEDQHALLEKLTIPAVVADLAQSRYGYFVARTLLQRNEVDSEAMAAALPPVAALLAGNP